jgi:hypothetical protein
MIPQILVGATIIGFGYYCYTQFKEVGRKSTVKPNSSRWVYFAKNREALFFAYNAVTQTLIAVSIDEVKCCVTCYENGACNINHHLNTYLRERVSKNHFSYTRINEVDFINQFNLASDKFDFSK